ncbi:response regulator transcription factor [Maribacter confluentis]|uniref:Response regulator transcription factor n=1 Tax=Maribacter confluentis TaxID=1656093 RepID=A0ABT8RS14_9FLAO|nr:MULTISPECIES: response regulator transcription factor [Maribacter]MDO1513683.1 response regulator transcription factor [Maribacter confluentis]TVZ16929.1 LuxR family two component transcriptional regulator [Maribacter sp. MAR_2009_72]
MIRLAIAEDHQALIDGLELLLKYEEDISIVGAVNDGEALLDLVRLKQPNVVITDIRMPKMDGIQATAIIKKEFPHIKILAFTMFDQDDAVAQMIDAGANGYILKNTALKEVLKAILTVAGGQHYYDPNINVTDPKSTSAKSGKGVLTVRQKEILKLIGQGKTSREISEELFIGTHTVDTHRKNMARILGLKGKGELLRYAVEKKYKF